MHTRRVATFLVGAWIGSSLFMAALTLAHFRSPARILSEPSLAASQFIKRLGTEDTLLLLRYQAAEQVRAYLSEWELAQFILGFAFLGTLFVGTQRKILPLVLGAVMIFVVAVQHFAITPEMVYRGREADFPPGNRTFATLARLWSIEQMYIGAESVKVLTGGVLASYLFVFSAGERRRRRKVETIDYPDHSHVDG